MNRQYQNQDHVPQRSPPVQQNFLTSAKFLLQWVKFGLEWLLNALHQVKDSGEIVRALRFAVKDPGEVVSMLRFLSKSFSSLRKHHTQADETLRLFGVTHVLRPGAGELFAVQEIYWRRAYERLQGFVAQPGWTVFDVGANTGVYTVQQARRGAYVYAFEPNPDCYRRLLKSVRFNNLEGRVTAVQCALGATAGPAELIIPGQLTLLGSLRPEWRDWAPDAGARFAIEVQTVDQVVRTYAINRIDLLKIDAEGFEVDILEGARETFSMIDRVVLEYESLDLGRRAAELLAGHGLHIVLDEKQSWSDVVGMLYAERRADTVSGRSAAGVAVA